MTKEEKIARYRKMNRDIEKGQVVCAGSSLMEMFPVEKLAQEAGYDVTIYNRGIGGFVTGELLENIDVCVLDLKPRRIFINIGTNDLSDQEVSIEDMICNYDRILTVIQDNLPGVDIYTMAYYPINYDAATDEMKPCLLVRTNDRIDQANAQVRELAEAHRVRYIDINEQGYRAIFDLFMKYVME